MNKGLAAVGIGIVALLAIMGFMVVNRGTGSASNPASVPTNQEAQTSNKKSLKDLMALGTNQRCSFSDEQSGSRGTMQVSGTKVRGDFEADVNGKTVMSHMLSDGTTMYYWMDGQTQGFQISMEATSKTQAANEQKTFDVNKQVDYTCSTWSPDQATFELPAGIQFSDFSSMMPKVTGAPEVTGDVKMNIQAAQCAACDQLPAESQAQCKAALSCN